MKVVALLFALFSVTIGMELRRHHYHHHHHDHQDPHHHPAPHVDPHPSSDNFDNFMLTQVYPHAACYVDDETNPGVCLVPSVAVPWTLHGLWPNRKDGSYPSSCSNVKFQASLIEPIKDKLEMYWPNILEHTATASLWEHEWEKHGTCSSSVPSVSGELNYFSKSIELHSTFDVQKALSDNQVVPSKDHLYSLSEITNAFRNAFGSSVQVHCIRAKEDDAWLLADVRICLSKEFKAIDCNSARSSMDVMGSDLHSRDNGRLPAYQTCPEQDITYLVVDNLLIEDYQHLNP